MSSRGRAWLALFTATAALLGTSAPEPVFVTIPPTEVVVPAGSVGRFRVVLTPQEEAGRDRRFLVVAVPGPRGPAHRDARVHVRARHHDGPQLELDLVPRTVAEQRLARLAPDGRGQPTDAGITPIDLAPCEPESSCTVDFTVEAEPPTDVVLILQHVSREAERTGIFPFDGPDVEGTKEREAERLHFFVSPPRPGP